MIVIYKNWNSLEIKVDKWVCEFISCEIVENYYDLNYRN